jgi:hypothetical protein
MVAVVQLRLWLPLWLSPLPPALAAQQNVNGSLCDGEEWDTEENLIFTTFLMMRAAIVLQHDVGSV